MLVATSGWLAFWRAFLEEIKLLLPGQQDLKSGITEQLDFGGRFTIEIASLSIPISDAVISIWITMILLAIVGIWLGHHPKKDASGKQTVAELLVHSLGKLCLQAGMNRSQAVKVIPFVGSLGLYIMCSNVLSLFKLKPPAQNPGFPIGLALITLAYVLVTGIRFVGLKGFWASLVEPMPALLPFKILDYLIKPISLAFRLFGNIFGAYILMEFVSLVLPLVLPAFLGLWFDLADGIIQALVFVYLTITYIGEIVEGAENAKITKAERAARKISRVGTEAALRRKTNG